MMPPPFKHKQFVRFVRHKAGRYGGLRTEHRHFQVWRKLQATNLDAAYAILAPLYAANKGRPARHPICMLRSCLAMMLCGVTSFTVWVKMMHADAFYALISGFHPQDLPGVGTFYDFQDRPLQLPRQPRTTLRRPYRRRNQRDKADQHKDKHDLRPHKDIINRLADRLLARDFQPADLSAILEGKGDFSALPRCEQTLQSVLFACFVSRSVKLKLIDLEHLHVAGDGSKLATWANPRGKKLCLCDNRGKKPQDRCRCYRAHNDVWGLWGWDSDRACWVYGHSFYELTAYNLQHRCQLPLVVSMADCNRHDSVHGLAALYHGRETFGLPIQTASLDAAHDAIGLFRLATTRWQTALVVPLNERNKDNLQYAGPLRLEKGVPVCPARHLMKRWGFCPDRLRIKWRCPLAAAKKTPPLTACPHFGQDCSASPYGRVIYTYPQENYRLHTLIPRDSDLWQCHRDHRSCAERSVKRKKYDFHLRETRTAGRERWFFRLILAAMCQHIDAWLIHAAHRLH
ncbi:MAG: hypothetical protein JSV36_11735 [Anaerolineae bacterium]|nr:MAG: hypothetical protein JSV36_11735 [Anaerolineae bacterium]